MMQSPLLRRAALACAMLALGASPAAASTRNYLTVEGRVFDRQAAALKGTWVSCIGSRSASVPVDSTGAYRLEIPGATLEELERTPLKIRIQARRKGYRFSLSNGTPELGLEMRVVTDAPYSRLRVRSNDAAAVAAVANSVVLDANPRALIQATFVGQPGAEYDTPPVPLDESNEIMLAGDAGSIPELAPSDSGPASLSKPPSSARLAAVLPPVATAPPSPATTPVMSPPATIATPPVVETAAPAEPQAPSPKRKWNAAGNGREERQHKVIRPAYGASGDASARKTDRKKRKVENPAEAPPPADDASPKSAPKPEPESSAATSSGTQATLPAGGIIMPAPAAAADSYRTAPPREASMIVTDPSLHPVLSRSVPAERVGSGPALPANRVPVAPGAASPKRPLAGPETAPMCDCLIRGTVEVHSDDPLSSRTEVVIAVEDSPEATASVELFMGSPRAFEIHPSPCGTHRLLLWTRSRQRFVLVSAEPRVTCTPGAVQQQRLVLEPVARWGSQ